MPLDPNAELMVILETSDRIQLAMAQGLLEDAGIPAFVLGQVTTIVSDADAFLHKWLRLQIPKECEAEARELLEPILHPVPYEVIDES
jgi:hypothetical protein